MSAGEQNQPPGESAIFTSAHMAEPPASRRRFYLYLLPILLFPVLLIATAFFVVPTDWFQQRADSTYLVNFGYATRLSGQDCPVLIYGDSTAMVGVDPRVITARTGLHACNIAEFEGMTLVTHTLLVDEFLAHNPRPRFLVFLYTPEDLSLPYDWSKVSTFEATSFLLRHERNLHTARVLAEHPGPTFGWAEQGLRMAAQGQKITIGGSKNEPRELGVGGQLLVPVMDTTGTIVSLQFMMSQLTCTPAEV